MIGVGGQAVVDTSKASNRIWRDAPRVDEVVNRGDEGEMSDFGVAPRASVYEAVSSQRWLVSSAAKIDSHNPGAALGLFRLL